MTTVPGLLRVLGDHPLTKGAASLFAALGFATLPMTMDAIRARRSAAPIHITAPPPNAKDSTPRCPRADIGTNPPANAVRCSR